MKTSNPDLDQAKENLKAAEKALMFALLSGDEAAADSARETKASSRAEIDRINAAALTPEQAALQQAAISESAKRNSEQLAATQRLAALDSKPAALRCACGGCNNVRRTNGLTICDDCA